ncbi:MULTISPECIES: FKBP-type peptidyl-prolyl cis-trans isomerase [unclassified Arsukibacterium]|uniref:FKBP-type peptidyl-prolyl cis-trans isomerase n=1 Tax=unclassified Arsukibacterium TaxID=2635278 RepID=UPI000C554530|nr:MULTISPECIES: peptidylprolyl isomerase [unclassified Arsukibacterium]MAA95445.1 peptidylprolyl isomerase [Rheinheimera sp.]MBM33551.1 peptidylprolyl isomerase [Rheinheimera sp.]HAW92868.1 peptidylprolyl isomerase [Candidatus Azambacteria bacterium]|tara:strand:- start:240030 stop:240515 length:486 start_codon:yes stop_codon:yes gene_type:complete
MTISQDKVVAMHYTVTDPEGNKLDSSADGEPLVFLFGHGALIPGLEQALAGKTVGDSFTATIAPADAYGERHDQLVQSVPKTMFEGMEVAPGMRFRAAGPDGREQSVIILDVTEEEVVVDGNHPLSGIELKFDVEVLKVRDATAEELAHGHVHGIEGDESH